jgi:hypothetical protein
MHRGLTWSCSRLTPSTCAGLSDSSGPCSTWSIANKPTGPRGGAGQGGGQWGSLRTSVDGEVTQAATGGGV